jgi:hypothetical protein
VRSSDAVSQYSAHEYVAGRFDGQNFDIGSAYHEQQETREKGRN